MTKFYLIFTYAVGFYLLIVLLIFLFQRSLLYLPYKEKIDESFFSNTGLKQVEFSTSDGHVLKSLYKKPSSMDMKTILLFHGNAGHVGHRANKFKFFLDRGYGLLLVEYRGYGENKGKPSEEGFYNDGIAAINFLSQKNITTKNIIVYGESLGCGISVKLSTEFSFYSTILEAPFTSISEVAQNHYWYLPAKWLVWDRHEILGIIKNIKSPLLVIHGKQDKIIKVELGQKIFEKAPEPKQFLLIKNAGHNNIYDFSIKEKIFSFLDKRKNIH